MPSGATEYVPEITTPGTPQCYGVSKHCNRTLLDSVWSKLSLTELPLLFRLIS